MRTWLARGLIALLGAGVGVAAAQAGFTSYSFTNITNNGSPDLGGQLSMTVSSVADPNQALFRFTNLVGIPSSICDVYFDDGALLAIASVSGSAGVQFSTGAAPGNLPGGQNLTPPFETSLPNEWFATGADAPVAANGVNAAAEYLDVLFGLKPGLAYGDVISSLADGSLRVGLHVQAIGAGEGSDSYVNTVVPAPAALSLGAMGLVLAYCLKRALG